MVNYSKKYHSLLKPLHIRKEITEVGDTEKRCRGRKTEEIVNEKLVRLNDINF
jgi:hypothetical protein